MDSKFVCLLIYCFMYVLVFNLIHCFAQVSGVKVYQIKEKMIIFCY